APAARETAPGCWAGKSSGRCRWAGRCPRRPGAARPRVRKDGGEVHRLRGELQDHGFPDGATSRPGGCDSRRSCRLGIETPRTRGFEKLVVGHVHVEGGDRYEAVGDSLEVRVLPPGPGDLSAPDPVHL